MRKRLSLRWERATPRNLPLDHRTQSSKIHTHTHSLIFIKSKQALTHLTQTQTHKTHKLMEALMLASHMHHQSNGQHSHKHKLWRSLAMHKLCKLNSLGRAMLNHISSWRRRKWERGRETCISLMEERSYALIHRVEMEVEVEKMMEEAIAKSLKAWGAPLHPSLHLRVTNDA